MAHEEEIFARIFTLTRDFERNFRDQGTAHLSTTQFEALAILRDGEPVTAMAMASRLKVAGPTATRTLDSLERRKLVVKERDPQDRRMVWLRLTQVGEAAMAHERERHRGWTAALLQDLTSEERQALLRLMSKLVSGTPG